MSSETGLGLSALSAVAIIAAAVVLSPALAVAGFVLLSAVLLALGLCHGAAVGDAQLARARAEHHDYVQTPSGEFVEMAL